MHCSLDLIEYLYDTYYVSSIKSSISSTSLVSGNLYCSFVWDICPVFSCSLILLVGICALEKVAISPSLHGLDQKWPSPINTTIDSGNLLYFSTSPNCHLCLSSPQACRACQVLSAFWDRQGSNQSLRKPLEKLELLICDPLLSLTREVLGSVSFLLTTWHGARDRDYGKRVSWIYLPALMGLVLHSRWVQETLN